LDDAIDLDDQDSESDENDITLQETETNSVGF
jgi:hypothetical protein